ncbi:hypothetical protein D6C89_03265 [Aureobasidium pullulans]|nr:hypothetical protein D6C89_03265 [Aureobasidium pullulans]
MALPWLSFTLTLLLIALIPDQTLALPQPESQHLEPPQLEPRGGGWTNAYWVSQQDLTAATQAQCPAWAPINCNAIQEPDYCCTPSTYCARASDNTIGCCPWGQTCNPSIAGGGAGGYTQQSSWVQPTTTWQQQPSTVYVTQGHATITVVYAAGQGQQTTVYAGQGQGQQYCSTLYAHGGNLPTTEVGTCGTILIANRAGKSREMGRMVLVSAVLMTIGGIILGVRGWL